MSFAALVLRARAANDTTQAQINNIPSKSHVIPLLACLCRSFNRDDRSLKEGHLTDQSDDRVGSFEHHFGPRGRELEGSNLQKFKYPGFARGGGDVGVSS